MFRAIRKHGLIPWGLTFHPGSQCAELATWTQALQSAAEFWATAQRAGAGLQAFIVGGGLPVSYRKRAASLAAVARSIKRTFAALPSPPEHCLLEPGRLLSAQAATLITSVVGVARRRERTWLFVDAGVFNGIPEALEFADRRFFEIATNPAARPARAKRVFIAGPSCHGLDTPFEDVSLPETALGDRLYVLDVGAYNSTNWCRFNGFELPDVQVYEALPTGAKRASSATPSARRRPSKGR
jgi:ornithine decarboxylase